MRYIHLSNDSYILYLSGGSKTLTRKSFNFNKIKNLINKGATEEEIIPLLVAPKITDGLYEAYLILDQNIMFIVHLIDTPQGFKRDIDYLGKDPNNLKMDDSKCLGIYTSKEDLLTDWPEYII